MKTSKTHKTKRSGVAVLMVIAAKNPHFDVFDEQKLKKPALKRATERKSKYFALTCESEFGQELQKNFILINFLSSKMARDSLWIN